MIRLVVVGLDAPVAATLSIRTSAIAIGDHGQSIVDNSRKHVDGDCFDISRSPGGVVEQNEVDSAVRQHSDAPGYFAAFHLQLYAEGFDDRIQGRECLTPL